MLVIESGVHYIITFIVSSLSVKPACNIIPSRKRCDETIMDPDN